MKKEVTVNLIKSKLEQVTAKFPPYKKKSKRKNRNQITKIK